MPPDHEVRVGPQPGDVIDPAHHNALPGHVSEQCLNLGYHLLAILRQRAGDLEH